MNLFNVRKGQFVYYKNELFKVYSVKPFFKKSVHLIRLRDYQQEITRAKDIDLHKPQHLDSFICNHKRYTLHKDKKAEIGDFILVINPSPDYLDNHFLNAIEMVASIETNGVISDRMNGIKHNEYWVMVPGLLDGANVIDFQKQDLAQVMELESDDFEDAFAEVVEAPNIGDVFQKSNSDPLLESMVIAIKGETVYLGGGHQVTIDELANPEKWRFKYHLFEQ